MSLPTSLETTLHHICNQQQYRVQKLRVALSRHQIHSMNAWTLLSPDQRRHICRRLPFISASERIYFQLHMHVDYHASVPLLDLSVSTQYSSYSSSSSLDKVLSFVRGTHNPLQLQCMDCSRPFTLSVERHRQVKSIPKRCLTCCAKNIRRMATQQCPDLHYRGKCRNRNFCRYVHHQTLASIHVVWKK